MESGKRKTIARAIGLIMTAMMLVTSNGVVMAAEIAQPTQAEQPARGMEEQNLELEEPGTDENAEDMNSGETALGQEGVWEEPVMETEEPKQGLTAQDEKKEDIATEDATTEVIANEAAAEEAEVPSEALESQPRAAETSADNLFEYSINSSDNTATINGYIGDETLTSLTIPDEIDGYTVVGIGDRAFRDTAFTEVKFPESLSSIDQYAFRGCTSLQALNFPNSLQNIGNYAFENCSALTEINFNEGLATLGSNAFSGCTSLTAVNFPKSLTQIGDYAFKNCSALAQIGLNEGLTALGSNAFQSCGELTAVKIPSTLTSVGSSGAFQSCGKLEEVTFAQGMEKIPAYVCYRMTGLKRVLFENNGSGIATIERSAFYECTSLAEIDFPKNLTAIENNAFYGNSALTRIGLNEGLQEIGSNAFQSCTALGEVKFPSTLVSIADRAFYNCNSLTGIELNEGLQTLGSNAFQSCVGLTEVRIPASLTTVGGSGVFISCDNLEKVTFAYGMEKIPSYVCRQMSGLKTIVFEGNGAEKTKITAIGDSAFNECKAVEKITFPESLRSIGSSAFYNCSALAQIELNDGLEELGNNAFQSCGELTEVYIPKSLVKVGNYGAFTSCGKLEKVTFAYGMEEVPSYVCRQMSGLKTIVFEGNGAEKTKITAIGDSAFNECKALEKITFPESLRSIGGSAFYNCSALAQIELNDGLEELGNSAFQACGELTEVYIPKSLAKVGNYGAFTSCGKLEKVTFAYGMEKIPSYMCRQMSGLKTIIFEGAGAEKTKITIIGSYAFNECDALETLDFPENLTTIEAGAFYGCDALKTLNFPKNLTTIENEAFRNCSVLAEVNMNEGLEELGGSAFQNCGELTEIRIPSTLTKAGTSGVFTSCSKLEKVTFAYGMEAIPEYICYNASGLKEIVYEGSGGSNSKITAIGNYAFYNCSALEVLTFPKNLTNIGQYAFNRCKNLATAEFPEGLTSIENYAFSECTSLYEIMLPESLEQIGSSAFYSCTSANLIYIGKNVFEIGRNAFYIYNQTETMLFTENDYVKTYAWEDDRRDISVADATYKAGENIKAGFFDNGMLAFIGTGPMDNWTAGTQPWKSGMGAITGLYIGRGIQTIGNYMLAGSSITDLIVQDGALQSIGTCAFDGCDELTYIGLGEGIIEIGAYAFRATGETVVPTVLSTQNSIVMAYDWEGSKRSLVEPAEIYDLSKSVIAYVVGQTLTIRGRGNMPDFESYSMPWKEQPLTSVTIMKGVQNIGNNSFYGFENIQSVKIPEGVKSIGDCAFYGCKSITEIVLPKSVNSLGRQAFYNCTALVSINLGDTDISGISSGTFENCQALRVVRIPASAERVENNAFKNCTQLNSLTLSEGVSYLGQQAFHGCEKLTGVTIPRSLNSVGSSGTEGPFAASGLTSVSFATRTRAVAPNLFKGCSDLKTVTFPTTLSEIGEYAFYGCTSLTQLKLPQLLYSIGNYGFYGCSGLADIQWPEDLQEIGAYAFYECVSITELPLLTYLESIGAYAFYGCENLATVEFGEGVTQINEGSFCKNNLKKVNLPYKVSRINSRAFAENSSLTLLTIPARTQSIEDNILENGASFITIGGSADSEAEKFAQNQGYMFRAQEGIAAQEIELSQEKITFAVNKTAEIKLTISPITVTDAIIWESEDETVASVAADYDDPSLAVITAKTVGQTEIRAKVGTLTVACEVEVGNYITGLGLDQSYVRVTKIGDTCELRAIIAPWNAENTDLVWKTSDQNIATVELKNNNSDGGGKIDPSTAVVTAVGNGIARITVSAASDDTVKAFCFVRVDAEVPVEDILISEEELLLTQMGKSRQLSAIVLPENATNQKVKWTSSDETVATVDQEGRVMPVAEGTAEITVAAEDGGKSASCEVTVQFVEVPVTGVSLNETTLALDKIGASGKLTAQVQPTNADIQDVQWISADEKIASVDENGQVTAKGGGTTTITVRTRDGGFEKTCQVTVKSLIEKITLNPTKLNLEVEESAQLTAVVTPYSTAVEWYSTNTKIAQVDKTGLVTAVAKGQATIKCRSVDGTNITAACQVVVGKEQEIPKKEEQKVTGITLNRKTASVVAGGKLTLKATVAPSNAVDKKVKWTSGNDKVATVSQTGVVTAKKTGKAVITVQSVSVPNIKSTCTITVTKPKVAKVKISSIKTGKKQLTVKWKKVTANGYQIQYSKKKNFSSKKNVLVSGGKKVQKKITKLKSGQKYYVRMRAYRTVNGQKYYGSWSTVKNKKTK